MRPEEETRNEKPLFKDVCCGSFFPRLQVAHVKNVQAVRADEGLLCGRDGRRRFAEHPHAEQIVQKKEVQRDEARGGALRAAQGGKGSLFHGGNRVEGEGAGVEPRGDEMGRGNPEGFRFGTARGPWGGSRFWAARVRAGRRTVRRRRKAAEMRRFCASGPRGGHAKARASGLRGARGPWGAVSRFGELLFCAAAFAFAVTTDGEAGQ